MRRLVKLTPLIVLSISIFFSINGFAQSKNKKTLSVKRQAERKANHSRDSLFRSLNKSDTSINSLLQRVEHYTTTYNQIKNNLSEGLDTIDISQQLPPVERRIDKVTKLGDTHKSSTLRYLFVLRDNLDRIQDKLEGWQSDMNDVSTKLVQNQNDLLKFPKDSLLKTIPADDVVRATFFKQLTAVRLLWHTVDSTNRGALLKVNLLQDQIAVSYTKVLDESDHIDSKIKRFALKAISGESDYIWNVDKQYNDFNSALKSTIKLNQILFNYFLKGGISTHLIVLLFFIVIFSWILYNRIKAIKNNEHPETIFDQANYIYTNPIIAALLVVTAITPYFYSHPPAIFLETFFLVSIILTLRLVRKDFPPETFNFLTILFILAIFCCISNLFIEISNIDRYAILILSIASIIGALLFYKKVKKSPDVHLPNTGLALKIFILLQVLSLLLNICGWFSLAKIIGITAVFNLWLVIILYFVVNIIIEGLYLQFQNKKGGDNFINWIDYNIVQKRFRTTLNIIAGLLWLFVLLQNLNIDDWAVDYVSDILNQSQSIGGASFTFGGFVIFIFVIWLSSIVSKVISYFYDVSARRVSDLSIAKKKNRTSTLLVRLAVFSIGFILAVAASNFPLEKLTIIISAFGVGIGFGLQNVVNNLVSGLILAFEKPIQIGDVIQVDGHTGTMKEIGIRSSKVVTGDGSEVIIPNGDLISHQVINWTLSDTNRQIELKIITAYGVDIEKVKALLKNLLSNREDIMTKPAPSVFLNNVNESAVEFRVLFWEADISTTGELKSRILAEIYQAISKEGIQMPSTQKDFYLHFPEGVPIVNPEEKINDQKDKKGGNVIKENPPDQAR